MLSESHIDIEKRSRSPQAPERRTSKAGARLFTVWLVRGREIMTKRKVQAGHKGKCFHHNDSQTLE